MSAVEDVLCSVLLLGTVVWSDVADILTPEHFPRADDQRIWRACEELARVGGFSELTVRTHLGDLAPADRLSELCNRVPNSSLIAEHAKQVRERACARALDAELVHLRTLLAKSPTEGLDAAISRITAVCNGRLAEATGIPIAQVVQEAMEELDMRHEADELMGTATGIEPLDKILDAGLCPGDLVVLAGRPGGGKTALSLQIARQVGRRTPVFVVNMEMDRQQLALRMISNESGVDYTKLRAGTVSSRNEDIARGCQALSKARMWIEDRKRLTVADVRLSARTRASQVGSLGLIVVDYLQLLQPSDPRTPREQQVAEMSREMKILAGELKCPILLLAQLNRESEKAQRAPRLSDLRESGAIEQDADVVMFVHREDQYKAKAEIIVSKQRNGQTGIADVLWMGSVQRFATVDQHHTDDGRPVHEDEDRYG